MCCYFLNFFWGIIEKHGPKPSKTCDCVAPNGWIFWRCCKSVKQNNKIGTNTLVFKVHTGPCTKLLFLGGKIFIYIVYIPRESDRFICGGSELRCEGGRVPLLIDLTLKVLGHHFLGMLVMLVHSYKYKPLFHFEKGIYFFSPKAFAAFFQNYGFELDFSGFFEPQFLMSWYLIMTIRVVVIASCMGLRGCSPIHIFFPRHWRYQPVATKGIEEGIGVWLSERVGNQLRETKLILA